MEEFYIEKRVYYHDTDAGEVVYYSRYLDHLEEGRTELFRSRGLDLKVLAEQDIYFVVARVEADFKAPAEYQDLLRIYTTIDKMRTAAILCTQRVMRDSTLIMQAKITLVCIGGDFKPKPVPAEIRKALEGREM